MFGAKYLRLKTTIPANERVIADHRSDTKMIVKRNRIKIGLSCFGLFVLFASLGCYGFLNSKTTSLVVLLLIMALFPAYIFIRQLFGGNTIMVIHDSFIDFKVGTKESLRWDEIREIYIHSSSFGPEICFELLKPEKPSIFKCFRTPSGGYRIPLIMVKPSPSEIMELVKLNSQKTKSEQPDSPNPRTSGPVD